MGRPETGGTATACARPLQAADERGAADKRGRWRTTADCNKQRRPQCHSDTEAFSRPLTNAGPIPMFYIAYFMGPRLLVYRRSCESALEDTEAKVTGFNRATVHLDLDCVFPLLASHELNDGLIVRQSI